MRDLNEKIRGNLIVSCQALPDEPLHSSFIMGRMALAAEQGGARGIRANTAEDIREIQKNVDLPVIGIVKREYQDSDIYITPTLREADELVEAGCEIIATDATDRLRPDGQTLDEFYEQLRDRFPGQKFMADCSTVEEALHADKLGFDYIGTGLYIFCQQNPALLQTAQQDQIFASFIAYQLPVGITGLLLAAIYAAAQSTLSTGLNSVATSWTLDIQERLTKKPLSFEQQTKIARWVSLGVGVLSIVVAMILANGQIKSAYVWFNSFMGLVLGVLAGTFVLGVFTKKTSPMGAYSAFAVSSILIIWIKYMEPDVSIWSYSLITIGISVIVGLVVSAIERAVTGRKVEADTYTTVYDLKKIKDEKKVGADKAPNAVLAEEGE